MPKTPNAKSEDALARVKELVALSQQLESQAASEQLERSKQYTTLIITLGYAGIFGVWSQSSLLIPKNANAVVGLMTGTSLALFCFFEILKMFVMQRHTVAHYKLVEFRPHLDDVEGLLRYSEAQKHKTDRFIAEKAVIQERMIRIWPWFFYPTVGLGYGAFFVLLYNFMAHLTGLPFFPG